ncbi:Wall-associated kinase family protein [Rhynchospora pubera]|uniref:Wall-associated kinase family protein n=1 Tax=Rhynchospora pubera TaxID=906938 RepID=A0AAV8H8N8_9POAL|nr:Wall-associated kinase family protein [Rhynchospora pubera]
MSSIVNHQLSKSMRERERERDREDYRDREDRETKGDLESTEATEKTWRLFREREAEKNKLGVDTGATAAAIACFLTSSVAQLTQSPWCPTHCGDMKVDFPFGVGEGCGRSKQFQLDCEKNDLDNFSIFVVHTRIEVLSISISEGQARVKSPINRLCYSRFPTFINPNVLEANLVETPFWLSSNANKFMVIGSGGLGGLGLITGTMSKIKSGCMAWQVFDEEILVDSLCSGIGCCESIIPYPSKYFQIYFDMNSLPASVFNTCRYAMLVEADDIFKFRTSYLRSPESFEKDAISLLAVLDWTISNDTCNIAQENMTSYACVSSHSKCIDYNNLGYRCSCIQGYQGNPYVPSGCQDIDECLNLNCFGICTNTLGSFKCECPPGTHGNGSISGGCYKNGQKIQFWGKIVIGFSIFIVVLLLSSSLVYSVYQRRKVAAIKRKYFQQYGGHLFLEEMKSKHGVSF